MPLTRAMAAAQAVKNNKPVEPKSNAQPPRKRTKTNNHAPKRSKKASLGRLLDMPPEVFNEIASHLLPIDILSLARSNKFFRDLLMSRASQHLWKKSLANVPDLPACPPQLCEPQYVSLLFSKTCSSCGARVLRRMDPYLYVRLCNSCRDAQLVEISLFKPIPPFLPLSDVIGPPRYGVTYALGNQLMEILDEIEQNIADPLPWEQKKEPEREQREAHSVALEDYLNMVEDERELELEDLKVQRLEQIEERLLEEGWTKRDMDPSPDNSTEWHKLVWQPKPITDRIWANLYPKLLPLLKSNKAFNDEIDKLRRRRARVKKIQGLTENIRLALPPLVHLKRKSAQSGTSSAHTSSNPEYPDEKVDQPFPTTAEFNTWPMIKNILDDDISPEDAETRFEDIRDEFDQAVVEWREKIEQDLVDIWNANRDGDEGEEVKSKSSTRKGKGKAATRTIKADTRKSRRRATNSKSALEPSSHAPQLNLPGFVITFTKPDGTSTTDITDLSPNMQLLLRADTVFKLNRYSCDYTYPDIVPRAPPSGSILGLPDELTYGRRWDPSIFKRDDEASALSKEMLALVGRLDATSAEMKALGGTFRCGRCNRTLPSFWNDLVRHYSTEQSRWKQAEEKIKAEPKAGFIFNNTHDLGPDNPKPFAHFMTSQASTNYVLENAFLGTSMTVCMRCEEMGIQSRYFHTYAPGIESAMTEHLRDVHNVPVARAGIDFRSWEHDMHFFDPYESDEEDFDSEEDLW